MKEKPIAYGYMRVRKEASDQELKLIDDRMHACADAHGLWLTYTHYEWGSGIEPHRLIRRLIKDDVRHVIVPSLVQITEHPLMQFIVSESITLDAGALLYEASGLYGRASVS
ncbi:hypothetical protein [Streptomyces ipomoeae]|uniref:Resolvase/invertase-type recombinase catalytic domain-containing protein n=1 Tax=Streptomyces ipomoeae 91-03 TaxID=698759 RepID=L1KJ41_9ACTN|nr:hypothetical protein [Streptomyces ipomoeae]EKX60612.1 hypothetical protein STRIP9103_01214 [Streptomyces ipomoeae 91-03]MDX2698691.1 hypothetical protein [Streptomyces ipomoeae]MDX2844379.1 hypothetical protein [Streptomyces ipomoeae]